MQTDENGRPVLPPSPRSTKKRTNPETRLQSQIMKALKDVPGLVLWRNNAGAIDRGGGVMMRFGLTKGASDLIGIYRGRFVGLEIKTRTGRLTAEQNVFLKTVTAYGGLAGVCRSLDDALRILGITE
jgi:hypothetical protein